MGEYVQKAGQQGAAHDPGANAIEGMNETVTDHANRCCAQGTDQNARRHRYRRDNPDNGFAGQYDIGGKESDVHHPGDQYH